MKKIIPLLALILSCLPLAAQVDYDGSYPWSETTSFAPDNAVSGWFYNLGITGLRVQLDPAAPRTLVVKHVFTNTPADPAGSTVHFRVGDVITGVEGQAFTEDHQDGYGPQVFGARGPIREFGIALDAAQGTDGILSVTRLRSGTTTTRNLTVGTTYGKFSPTFPTNCPKSDLILSQLLTYLRQTQNTLGYWEGVGEHENHIFAGLALLSDGSTASMTAAGKLATYYKNETNLPISPDGLDNWKYLAAAIYLSEYYHKTNDATVLTKLNTLYGYLLASQYTNVSQIVPGYHGDDPTTYGFGGWGHNPGYEGYGPIAMLTGQGALALSLMKRVGVNVDRTRLDAAYAFLVKGTSANKYVWYADQDGSSGDPKAWADPGRTGAAAIANWMSPYTEPAYAVRAIDHARFMGDHPQSFPDTHGSPTIGMAYAAMGTHIDPLSFRKLLDNNLWWFSLAHTPEGNFYYQPNRDNAGYGANPRFQASSVAALILSLPKRNLMISEDVFEMAQASFSSQPAAISTTAISMTATTGTTNNGPMEYLFTETSGNPGATSSVWQTSPNYTDSGLSTGTQYSYTVTMRDALGIPGPASAPASATTQQGQQLELMSLNFYSYGSYAPVDYNKVTLEAAESAGVGPYHVSGWQNYAVPWNPSSPATPFTLTSNLGATAAFTFNDVRNGWTFDGTPNTNVTGANADLMNSHANGTEDPYDGSMVFDMEVTSIPYQVYDLIVYLGANQAQFGDGTGKFVMNGGPQQGFTLTSGEFSGFTEITNATTPGNYIIFPGLRNPSLTLKVWGNGFNHIGPTGFQIVKDSSGVIPPGPAGNPNPSSGSVGHAPGTDVSWTGGLSATSRKVYFGTNPTPGASEFRGSQTATTYDPGNLTNGTYYWRIDEVNADGTTPGPVWSFTVGPPAKAFRPMPWNGIGAVAANVGTLKWVAGASATASSHDVYFGTDSTPDASEFIGNQSGTTYNAGTLNPGTTYYWRIDEVNAQGTTTGDVWSFTTPINGANKVKVFILAGQSNMEGHGEMTPSTTPGTLQNMYDSNPVAYAHLKSGSNWTVRNDVWAWFRRDGGALQNGDLTAGYGANTNTIGPELQIGHIMGDHYGQKVLLIKTAWGGKSLRTDFRPPSSGWSKDVPVTNGDEGYYFKVTLDTVVDVLANLQTYFPTHNPADGFEIAGFGWHQGWNDRVTPAFAAEYEVNMARFIRDVRSAVGVPAMPFVIGTTGMDGNPDYSEVELAQLQMENFTAYPDFNGNVAVVDTQSFWFPVSQSPADQGYHWNRNAASYYQVGNAMGLEMKSLIVIASNTAPVATAQSVSTAEDTAKAITLAGTDAENNSLTYSIVTQPASGTLSGTAPNLTYTPAANFNGTTSFTFKVNDGTIDSNTATVSITVNAVNDVPVAVAQIVTTVEDTAKSITLAGTDVENSALTYSIVTQPASGTLSGTAPNVTYTPAANFTGAASFTFKVNDGTEDSVPATVSITVTPDGTITWGTATAITSASDIRSVGVANLAGANFGITTGTTTIVPASETGSVSVEFRSLRSGQNVTLSNGINVAAESSWANWGFATGNSSISGNFGTVLDSNLGIETGAPVSPSANITLSGLTIGTRYQIQLFADSTGSNSQTISGSNAMNSLSGQSVTGTFTADATSKVLTITRNTDFAVANALTIGTVNPGYTVWSAGPFPSGLPLSDSNVGRDFDGGGLPTGIEWVVGGDPTNGGDDAALAPIIGPAVEPGFHVVTYRLSNQAAADGATDAFIEYSTGLGAWTKAIHNGDTIRITTTPGPSFATVEVKLKNTLAPNGRLFVHLKATVNP